MKDIIYNPLQEKRILLPFKTRQQYIKAFWGGKIVKIIQRKESQLLKLTNAKVHDRKKIKKLNSELNTSLESLWEDYLEGEDIIKSSQNQWIKVMGARKQNWTDSNKRGGHTYVGKAIASKYLLIGSKLFDAKSDTMYILWPLMPSADISELNVRLKKDKEWIIISKAERKNMRIKTFGDLRGVSNELQQLRKPLLEPANLNKSPNKGNKNKLFTSLKDGLKDGSITLT